MKPICTAAPPIQQKHQEYMCSRSAIETTFYDVGIFWNPLMVSSKAFGGWKKHFDPPSRQISMDQTFPF